METQKSHRRRKKKLLNRIRQQMEFYFSDANLRRDRFMGQFLSTQSHVPFEEFLKFNRIREMTTSISDIRTALSTSKILDMTEEAVFRKVPFDFNKTDNMDDHIIYVESLPPKADHQWLEIMFKSFGDISYISLPRYSSSKLHKGFCFIEFKNKESVEECVSTFREFNGIIAGDCDPATLSIFTSQTNEKNENVDPEQDDESKLKPQTDKKTSNNSENITEQHSQEEAGNGDVGGDEDEEEALDSESEDENEVKAKRPKTDFPAVKKKNRIRKKRKSKEIIPVPPKPAGESLFDLKVLTKNDWKKLRNIYLAKQREMYKHMKKQVAETRAQNMPRSMNFYSALPHDNTSGGDSQSSSSINPPSFEFQEGLIVHILLEAPLIDCKKFKESIMKHCGVNYVDAHEGTTVVYVRTSMPHWATALVKTVPYPAHILEGLAENEYWHKINYDRKQKLTKAVRTKKERSRDKLKAAAARHVRFDDDW